MNRWEADAGAAAGPCWSAAAGSGLARCCSASRCWWCWPRRWSLLRGARAGAPADQHARRPRRGSTTSSLHEGQGTRSRLLVTEADGVEHVTRVSAQAPYVALHPAAGAAAGPCCATASPVARGQPAALGAARRSGEEQVALTSAVGGLPLGAGARARARR